MRSVPDPKVINSLIFALLVEQQKDILPTEGVHHYLQTFICVDLA